MSELVVQLAANRTTITFGEPQYKDDAVFITDTNTFQFAPEGARCLTVSAGEGSKSIEVYQKLLSELANIGARRKTTLIALGGGVVGDLAGFLAATYMRGLPLIQVPTTLLSMVDSAVGGKVGLDLPEGKNLVGAFYPATEVFIDVNFLKTLPARQFSCGMAEVIKYGFIQDPNILAQLATEKLCVEKLVATSQIIRRCLELKKEVVEDDEFETKGRRAILNFGHTVGHALEKVTEYKKFTHGEAISIGMIAELLIGIKLGITQEETLHQAKCTFQDYELPTSTSQSLNIDNIVEAMRADKKSEKGEVTMSLVSKPGHCDLITDIPESLVREVLLEL